MVKRSEKQKRAGVSPSHIEFVHRACHISETDGLLWVPLSPVGGRSPEGAAPSPRRVQRPSCALHIQLCPGGGSWAPCVLGQCRDSHLQLDQDIWNGRISHGSGDKSHTTSCIPEVEDLCNPLGKQRTRSLLVFALEPPVQELALRVLFSQGHCSSHVQLQLCLWYGWWESYSA